MLYLKKKGKKKIKFVSDKLAHYKTMHSKLFRNAADITHGIPIKAKQKGLKYNNNVIECEHPDVNQRINLDLGRNKTLGLIYVLEMLCPEEFTESFSRFCPESQEIK